MRGCGRARARGDSVVAGLHVLAGCLRSPSTPMTLVFGGGGGLESVCVCVTPLGRCVYVCVCSPSSGGVLYIALHAIFRIYYRLRPIHRGISPRTAASRWVGKISSLRAWRSGFLVALESAATGFLTRPHASWRPLGHHQAHGAQEHPAPQPQPQMYNFEQSACLRAVYALCIT